MENQRVFIRETCADGGLLVWERRSRKQGRWREDGSEKGQESRHRHTDGESSKVVGESKPKISRGWQWSWSAAPARGYGLQQEENSGLAKRATYGWRYWDRTGVFGDTGSDGIAVAEGWGQ